MIRAIILAILTTSLVGCNTTKTAQTTTVQKPTVIAVQSGSALSLFNLERRRANLPPYQSSKELEQAALKHASDMAGNGYFSHTGLDGSSVKDRTIREGLSACYWAENIGKGSATAKQATQVWMKSKPHKANILSKRASMAAVGNSGDIWVAVFAGLC